LKKHAFRPMKMAIVHQLSIIKLIADFIKTDQKDLMV